MDYRYDPMYQRGHDPSGREQQPAAQPGPDPEPVEVSPVTPVGEAALEHGNGQQIPPPEPATGSNPYLLVLMISGLVLIAAGIVSIVAGGQLMNMRMMPTSVEDQQGSFQMMTYGQSLITLGPFLLALGVGTLLGVTFLKAHNWQRLNPGATGRR
ncbi:hypothetical protein [Arthrobacter pigmenti]